MYQIEDSWDNTHVFRSMQAPFSIGKGDTFEMPDFRGDESDFMFEIAIKCRGKYELLMKLDFTEGVGGMKIEFFYWRPGGPVGV